MPMHWGQPPATLEDVRWLAELAGVAAWRVPEPQGAPMDGPRLWSDRPDPAPPPPTPKSRGRPDLTAAGKAALAAAPAVQPTELWLPAPAPRRVRWPRHVAGCPLVADGLLCGPAFEGGPLAGEHAHRAFLEWPAELRYTGEGAPGTYGLTYRLEGRHTLVPFYDWWANHAPRVHT